MHSLQARKKTKENIMSAANKAFEAGSAGREKQKEDQHSHPIRKEENNDLLWGSFTNVYWKGRHQKTTVELAGMAGGRFRLVSIVNRDLETSKGGVLVNNR